MKLSIVLLLGIALAAVLHRRPAALRHWVLALAVGSAAALPILPRLVPGWTLPLNSRSVTQLSWRTTADTVTLSSPPATRAASAPALGATSAPKPRWPTPAGVVASIWIAGMALSLGLLCVGLARLSWLAARAAPPAARWLELAAEISAEYGVRRPVRLFQSSHPSLLATWGWRRPSIILPAPATAWSDDRVRVVLCHELAHVRRGDWLAQMLGELLRAAYWFNPLVWIVCAALRLESERACDDEVLNHGTDGPVYATHLVAIARALSARRSWVPAAAMARQSTLHRRVAAMLNDRVDRQPVRLRARLSTVAFLVCASAAIAAAQTFGTFSGSLVDPLGGVLPGAHVTLSSAQRQAKYEVESTGTGEFEIPGLPPGDYALEVQLPGFQLYRGAVTVAGGVVRRDITLQLGTVHESITVDDAPVSGDSPSRTVAPRSNPECRAVPASAQAWIGGNLRPPQKIKDVRPSYPANLRGTGAAGEVVLDAVIGTDGVIKDIQSREGAQPEFAEALITAAKQWQFDSTMLNCVPIEVPIVITGRFVAQR